MRTWAGEHVWRKSEALRSKSQALISVVSRRVREREGGGRGGKVLEMLARQSESHAVGQRIVTDAHDSLGERKPGAIRKRR